MANYITNINDIWDEVLTLIAPKISVTFYDVWIKNLTPVQLTDDKFYLLANLESTKNVVNNKYIDIITDCVKKVHPFINKVVVFSENDEENAVVIPKQIFDVTSAITDESAVGNLLFNDIYTFDNFVVGSSNEVAYAAAKAVAENPGKLFNPLFVYGGVGLGKTHIIHAIGNYILSKNPNIKIKYISTENFTNAFIKSIDGPKEKQIEFRDTYRNVDVLMMDDIQFIAKKTASQEALFHTFNDLYQMNKQIIFTSDCHPKDLNFLEDRLRSRFQCGMTVDITHPDLETRIAILKSKAFRKKFVVSDSVINYIAEKIDTNIRELEASLSKVMFYCSLTGDRADSIDKVNLALKDEFDTTSGAITIDYIVNQVCSYLGIDKKEVIGKKKTKAIVEARQIAIYIITELLSVTLTTIGDYFSGRDYSTIIHARDKISALCGTDVMTKNSVSDIINVIKGSK